jgi:hypothetical protein
MNYIDDISTYLAPFLTVPIYLEDWAKTGGQTNQVIIESEPGIVEADTPVMVVKFGVYSRAETADIARNNCNIAVEKLANLSGVLDPASGLTFQKISVVSTPYYWSGEGNTPIYLATFEAVCINNTIKTINQTQ